MIFLVKYFTHSSSVFCSIFLNYCATILLEILAAIYHAPFKHCYSVIKEVILFLSNIKWEIASTNNLHFTQASSCNSGKVLKALH
jgi:hypothetical protein